MHGQNLVLLMAAAVAWAQQLAPQVAILRQINHVNDDGSYTYGYEAADGSFKIETRDAEGTVRGMFGFVDERGRQRRVSYTAGNTTGFQTTGEPPSEAPTPTPRPVRPLPAAHGGHRDSVAKLIRHLGILGAKQSGSHRFLHPSEPPTTAASVRETTGSGGAAGRESTTTRRPSVVQRIVRPEARRVESTTRKPEEVTESTTEKREEEKVEPVQRRPVVRVVTERPHFVVVPSRLLRWRPGDRENKADFGEEEVQPEALLRQRLTSVPVPKDSIHYRLRQLPREQLASPQTPLQIFAQKSEIPSNYQEQQYYPPQKNIVAFLPSTPRPNTFQSRPIPVFPPIQPSSIPRTYSQAYQVSEPSNGSGRVFSNDGNYAPKAQQVPQYLPHPQLLYHQKPPTYNVDANRYNSYQPRPNPYPPTIQGYPIYGPRGLIELLLAYLQQQQTPAPPPGDYANQFPADPRNIIPQPQYVPENSGFTPPAIFIPYPAPADRFQIPVNNVAPVPNNYEYGRIFDQRLNPTLIRQPINTQNRVQRPIPYNNGINPYVRRRGNVFPVNYLIDPQNVNFRQGVPLQAAPLQLQPLYVDTARSHPAPLPLSYPVQSARQGAPVSVTTVSPRSAVETPSSSESQDLPFGFTKKFRSVEVIAPDTEANTPKNQKTDEM
ncbi:uncharacterized protein LOC124170955 [Ischnura elegans]|uniref:uncharacterized protein LOC124170955 n=1 Tax=Ischnura elegans TaxID=197161 RepID=UPI001ED8A848|nr:uncharacterized protein LOC124170955 [Ischnura elegans]